MFDIQFKTIELVTLNNFIFNNLKTLFSKSLSDEYNI